MLASSIARVLVGAAAGAITWTGTEYAMHRCVLHGPFGKGRLRYVPLGGLHRAHHTDPLHTSLAARSAGHMAVAGVAALASSGLSTLVAPTVARAASAAWAAGYSTYEISHWNFHHRPATTSWGARQRERHHRHHFGAPNANLGVTHSFWDHLLGTEAASAGTRS